MNAPQKRGQNEFVDVQNIVMEDKIIKEGVASDKLVGFILHNAPLFRFFAEHLPDELSEVWINTKHDDASRVKLESAYEEFYSHIAPFIETYIEQLDPDAMTQLSEAIDNGQIEFVANLIESWVALDKKLSERIEE